MVITKKGETQKSVVYFSCWRCGCEFNCDVSECKRAFRNNEDYFAHRCPCCGEIVTFQRAEVGYDYFD